MRSLRLIHLKSIFFLLLFIAFLFGEWSTMTSIVTR